MDEHERHTWVERESLLPIVLEIITSVFVSTLDSSPLPLWLFSLALS